MSVGRVLGPNESVSASFIAGTNLGVQKHDKVVAAGGIDYIDLDMEEVPLVCGVENPESCESCT